MIRNKYLLIVMVMTVIVFIAACQGAKNDTTTTGNDDNANDSEPQEGGDLVVATPAAPPSLDWAGQGATDTKLIAWHIFEQLFAPDEDYQIKPMLADDYEVSDDGKTYTISIREDVKFHDGSEMTVDDVIESMNHWRDASQLGTETYEHIDKVEAIDDYTFEVQLKDEFSALLSNFADVNHALYVMPEELAKEAGSSLITEEQAIGTGPYQLKEFNIGEDLTLERFNDYTPRDEEDWGGLTGKKIAYHDTIKFKVATDSQVKMNGVKSGEFDYAIDITPDLYEVLEQDQNINTIKKEMNTFSTLLLNHSTAPFEGDKDLAEAVNHALNKEEIMSVAYGSDEFYDLDGALFSEFMVDLYTEEGTDLYDAYDFDKAKALIDSSNYDGEVITLITTNDYDDYEKTAQVVQKQLEDVGFNVEIETFEWGTFFDKWDDPEAWELVVITWPWYHSPLAVPIIAEDQHAGWHDLTNLFDLQDEWASTEDEEEQLEIIGDIQKEIWEETIWIKLGNSIGLHISNSDLHGYEDWDDVRFWNTWSTE